MEGLIIMIVISIISALFSRSKSKEQKPAKTQMPPFSNSKPSTAEMEPKRETRSQRSTAKVQSLEDFTKEVFGQLQEKQQPKSVSEKMAIPVEKTEPTVVQRDRLKTSKRPVFKNRAELGANRPIIQRERQKQSTVVIPTTRQQLIQSVVMSEVLGSPKAKQR